MTASAMSPYSVVLTRLWSRATSVQLWAFSKAAKDLDTMVAGGRVLANVGYNAYDIDVDC